MSLKIVISNINNISNHIANSHSFTHFYFLKIQLKKTSSIFLSPKLLTTDSQDNVVCMQKNDHGSTYDSEVLLLVGHFL